MRGFLKKDVSHPWLGKTLQKGITVYKFENNTFGAVSEKGIAVSSFGPMSYPFMELREGDVEWEN